jgi:hypothetical protein
MFSFAAENSNDESPGVAAKSPAAAQHSKRLRNLHAQIAFLPWAHLHLAAQKT